MFVRRLLAVASAAALLTLTACGGDDEPTPIVTGSPTPSPSAATASESTDPLAIPAAAKEPTKAGAEALIRHFWDMVNHLRETGDAAPIRSTYAPECSACEAGTTFYEKTLEQGGKFDGGVETVTRVRARLTEPTSKIITAYAVATTSSTDQLQLDAQGDVEKEFPGGKTDYAYGLTHGRGHWKIVSLEESR